MSESSKKWYVLRAAGGKEKKAKEYLEKEIERRGLQDLVSQVLVPTEKVYRIRDGKRVCTERLFYPGYVLIYQRSYTAHLCAPKTLSGLQSDLRER